MTIKKLKEIIKDLPDDMPFILFDISTDDPYEGNYSLGEENFEVIDLSTDIDDVDAPMIQGLALCFENNLNENSINK